MFNAPEERLSDWVDQWAKYTLGAWQERKNPLPVQLQAYHNEPLS